MNIKNGVVVINDLPYPTTMFDNKRTKNNGQIQLFNESALVAELKESVFKQLSLNYHDTVFLYPGESARRISKTGFSEGFTSEFLFAKRTWIPGNDPMVTVETMKWGLYLGIKSVVVVDDVISSGITVQLARERNNWKFPGASWYAVVPVSRKNKLSNFKQIFSCVYVEQGIDGKKIPINSLSTLLENQWIRQNYFNRNFVSS